MLDGWAAGRRTAQVLRRVNRNRKVAHLALTRVLRVTVLCSVQSHLPLESLTTLTPFVLLLKRRLHKTYILSNAKPGCGDF